MHPRRLNPYTANRWVGILQTLRPELKNEVESWASNEESLGRIPSARPDDATPKQTEYLRSIGHTVSGQITRKEAQRLITGAPTEGQLRRLKFYGVPLSADANKEDASYAIDRYIREHPESEGSYQAWKDTSIPKQPTAARGRPWWRRLFGG